MLLRKARETLVTMIVIDGLNEEDFRRSIENRLREGRGRAAIERLRAQLTPYVGAGGLLPERFLTVNSSELALRGWDVLEEAVSRYDQPGRPVTAVSVTFGWPGDVAPEPDAEGGLRPHIETSYFNDNAFPFSQSGREDLLEGYSFYGCTWTGDAEATDAALSLEGIDDLQGALAQLESSLLASDDPDEDGVRAGSLGACLLSTLLVQAVGDHIERIGLARPLCVMAGSSGVYPYFDAPVAGMPPEVLKAAEAEDEEEAEFAMAVDPEAIRRVPGPRYSSLLVTQIPRGKKRAAIVLDENEEEMADRLARLRGINHPGDEDSLGLPHLAPAADLPEHIEFMPLPPGEGPLLAKKTGGKPWDFRDLLGDPAPEPHPPERPWSEPPVAQPLDFGPAQPDASRFELFPIEPPSGDTAPGDWADPQPLVAAPVQWPDEARGDEPGDDDVLPGFTLIEPSLQERLQGLLSAATLPLTQTPAQVLPQVEVQPAPDSPEPAISAEDSSAPPVRRRTVGSVVQPASSGVIARLWSWIRGSF